MLRKQFGFENCKLTVEIKRLLW